MRAVPGPARSPTDVRKAHIEAVTKIAREILKPLTYASKVLPDDPALAREQARWRREYWRHLALLGQTLPAIEQRPEIDNYLRLAEQLSPGHPLNRVASMSAQLAFLDDPYASGPDTLARLEADLDALRAGDEKWADRMYADAYRAVFRQVERREKLKTEKISPEWLPALDRLAVWYYSSGGIKSQREGRPTAGRPALAVARVGRDISRDARREEGGESVTLSSAIVIDTSGTAGYVSPFS